LLFPAKYEYNYKNKIGGYAAQVIWYSDKIELHWKAGE